MKNEISKFEGLEGLLYGLVLLVGVGAMYGTLTTRISAVETRVESHDVDSSQLAMLIQKVDDIAADVHELKTHDRR